MLAATLSPTYGIYSGYEHFENVPVRAGCEEYLDSEKYEAKQRALDGPLLPLVAPPQRRSGARTRRCSTSTNVTFLETENDALIAYVKRTGGNIVICVVNLDPHHAQEGVGVVPAELGLPPAFAVARPAHRRALRLAHRAQLRAPRAGCAGPRPAGRGMSSRPRHHWFEADPLWFKTAVFYEIHIRGFFDGNGDGSGDFRGLTEKLDYLQWLGVDCIWLLPIYSVAAARRRLRHRRLLRRSTPTTATSTTCATSSRPPTSAASA